MQVQVFLFSVVCDGNDFATVTYSYSRGVELLRSLLGKQSNLRRTIPAIQAENSTSVRLRKPLAILCVQQQLPQIRQVLQPSGQKLMIGPANHGSAGRAN